jgi:hypothetical protein
MKKQAIYGEQKAKKLIEECRGKISNLIGRSALCKVTHGCINWSPQTTTTTIYMSGWYGPLGPSMYDLKGTEMS